jgi:hypothetical protein
VVNWTDAPDYCIGFQTREFQIIRTVECSARPGFKAFQVLNRGAIEALFIPSPIQTEKQFAGGRDLWLDRKITLTAELGLVTDPPVEFAQPGFSAISTRVNINGGCSFPSIAERSLTVALNAGRSEARVGASSSRGRAGREKS